MLGSSGACSGTSKKFIGGSMPSSGIVGSIPFIPDEPKLIPIEVLGLDVPVSIHILAPKSFRVCDVFLKYTHLYSMSPSSASKYQSDQRDRLRSMI